MGIYKLYFYPITMSSGKQHIWRDLFGWACLYIFWVVVFQRTFAFSQTLTVQFCYLLFIAANFYFNIYVIIPRLLYHKKYLLFVGCLLGGVALTSACRVPLATWLNYHYFLVHQPQPGARALFATSFLNIFIWVVFVVAGKLAIDRYRLQQYVDRMEKEKSKAELDFLNAQFNPHFLFNSINSIYGHIDKQNTTARNMLLTFSEMLRYQLYECNTETISIDKEIGYLRNYVVMQKARKEDSLVVDLQVDDQVNGFSIAPLLFIAFIENAFKYVGNSEEKENRIRISFVRTGNLLHFKCSNTMEGTRANSIRDKGIGISNASRRMALLYPDRHELKISNKGEQFDVSITLQLS